MKLVLVTFLYLGLGLAGAGRAAAAGDFRLEFFADIRGLAEAGQHDEAERRVEEAFLAATDAVPEDRVALLDTLAGLQLASGKEADAGDTLWNKAAILTRRDGPQAPDLGAVYAAAGRAYYAGGQAARAVTAFEVALRIDRRYLPCGGAALAGLYGDLVRAYAATGQDADAREARRLADDAEARCALTDPTRSAGNARTEGEGEFALVRVLYATDRVATGEVRPNEFFGAGRGSVSYGEAVVTIPREHKPGKIEAPSLLTFNWTENPALHVVLMSVDPLDRGAFFAEVAKSLGPQGTDEIFLFIHGYNTTFDVAAKRTAQLVYDLNFDGTPVFYSWPSRGHAGSYMADAASVQVSARHLTVFLEDLVERSGGKRIQIVAHSMGNRALTAALEIYTLRHPKAAGVFDQIVFAAPDVDSDLFLYQTGVFARLARRMTLYTSDADLALSTSKQLHGNPRAGLASGGALVGDAFDTIDMSVVGAGLLNHTYFASDASGLSDILWLFWRNPPPPGRCGMTEEIGEGGAHWIYVAEQCESNILLSALSLARLGGEAALARLDTRIAKLRSQDSSGSMSELLEELDQVRLALLELLAG
ncbi:MAG: alpha/beta hydrolase [Rhodobacteraceae bacterium]|nr:alpha/beta hydrolase [Paracoccaceae bacterium]